MKVEDGGATFSLIVCDQPLTLHELDSLQNLNGVETVLARDNTVTVIFKVDSFWDITSSAIVDAQQAIKKALYSRKHLFSQSQWTAGQDL